MQWSRIRRSISSSPGPAKPNVWGNALSSPRAPDRVATTVGQPVIIDVAANDNDPEGHALQPVAFTLPDAGTLTLGTGGAFLYVPNEGFVGTDGFDYTIRDAAGATATGTVSIEVTRANRSPVAVTDSVETEIATPVTIVPLANDNDPDGDPIRITALTVPAHGTLDITDGGLVYLPANGFTGTDHFTYVIDDHRGGTATGAVEVTVLEPSADQSTFANGYHGRRRLVVPPRAAPAETVRLESGFVLFVRESGDWLKSVASGGRVEHEAGFDIRFEAVDGTVLAHELIAYDPELGRLEAWVRVPLWDRSASLQLFLYYGKSDLETAEADPAGVWADYLAVWDVQSGIDRSGHGRDLTLSGVGSGVGPGGAQSGLFDGDATATLADASFLDGLEALTVQARIEAAAVGTNRVIISQGPITGEDADQGFLIRYDAQGFFGGAERTILWQVDTADSWTRIEAGNRSQSTDEQHLVGVWQKGLTPALFAQGRSLNATNVVDRRDAPLAVGAGPITIGAAAKDGPDGGWQGLIGEVRLRASALPATLIAAEYANQSAPDLFYGLGDDERGTNGVASPVAVPFDLETLVGQRIDLDVVAAALPVEAAPPPVILALDQPQQGIVSVVDGIVRYVPNAGFVGEDGFTYTLTDGIKSSTARVRIKVVGAGVQPGHWIWSFAPPTLPADRNRVKTWRIGEQALESISLDVDDVLLGILPDRPYTGTVAWKTPEIPCPFVLVGGDMKPKRQQQAHAYDRWLNGVAMLFRWSMRKNVSYRGGRPFYFLSHIHVDWKADDIVWADFMRGGMPQPAALDRMPLLYLQNLYFNGGCIFFNNDTGRNPGMEKFQPHSDVYQGDGYDIIGARIGRCRIEWRGQCWYTSPGSAGQKYQIGQNWVIKDTTHHPLPRPSYHPVSRKIEWVKPYKATAYDFDKGQYPSFAFDNMWMVIDPEDDDPTTYFGPRGGIGGTVGYDASTRRMIFPTARGGANPEPIYAGTAYAAPAGQEPSIITPSDVGLDYRIADVDTLYAAFGQN